MSNEALQPEKLRDRSIRAAYLDFFDPDLPEKKMGTGTVLKIIRAALDKKRVSKTEKNDLKRILSDVPLTDKARDKLEEFSARTITHLKGKRKLAIAEIISDPSLTRKIKFKFGPNHYKPADYGYIAQLVRDDDIDVFTYRYDEDTGFSKSYGLYSSGEDDLFVADLRGSRTTIQRWSTIIHEATHAIQDKQNKSILVRTAEAGAHIAQAVMLMTMDAGGVKDLYGRLKKPGILNAARKVYAGESLTAADAEAARTVIDQSSYYGSKSHKLTSMDAEWYSYFETLAYWLNT